MTAEHDWEADPRPFGAVLADWIKHRGGNSAAAARDLRVPYGTLRDWLSRNRATCANEGALRRLMTLIDRWEATGG